MISQNVFIINFNPLYEILNDIKENLSFKITKFENENDFNKNKDFDKKNILIILNSKNKLILNKSITEKNFLVLDDLPLALNKILELIHSKLIKLKFNNQSKVNIRDYELNLNSKFFSKEGLNIKLTEKEIEIILYLYQNKIKHNVIDLQKNIWHYSSDMETHTVETHIYRLRKKINDRFKDESFILSHRNGYYID